MSSVPYNIGDSGKTKKRSYPTKSKEESQVEDGEGQQSGAEDEDRGDDEEEYEIEAISSQKRVNSRRYTLPSRLRLVKRVENSFISVPQNKYMYLVRWKGYGPDHNSWVAEDDAGNATLLIKAFWDEIKKKSPQKGAKTASKRPRKSMQITDASDAGGSSSVANIRGRKSVSEKPADKDEEGRPAKKLRKASEKKAAMTDARTTTSMELLPDKEVGTTPELLHAPTWDQLIERIDTVERVDGTLRGGERIREDSKICADKFPKMLIDFYESHLRWKEADH